MGLIQIEESELKAIHEKLDTLTAMLKQNSAINGLSKYMDEAEVMQVTRLKKDALRMYRRYDVFTKHQVGNKVMYLRKEVEALVDNKLAHKIFIMRETIKEQKQKTNS